MATVRRLTTSPKTRALGLTILFAAILIFGYSARTLSPAQQTDTNTKDVETASPVSEVPLSVRVQAYLEAKNSPMAPDTEFLMEQEHWRLLIAISAIESQFCKRQLGYNCWGVGGDSAYRHYSSFRAAIVDANDLITRWQTRGRWLTIEDMNCHYVVPCSENWVRVVNATLEEIPK
jgi:hypothetical protein